MDDDNSKLIEALKAQVSDAKRRLFDLRVEIRRKERAIQALEGEPVTVREPKHKGADR